MSDLISNDHHGVSPSRVLVVEDDPTNRHAIETFLKLPSYIVDFASDGSDGLEMALTRSYDVILTDLRMPRMTGDKMVRELLRHSHLLENCQIAVMSTVPYNVTGVSAYLQKPFKRAELTALIDEQTSIAYAKRVRRGNLILNSSVEPYNKYDMHGMGRFIWGSANEVFKPDPTLMRSPAMQRKRKNNWQILLGYKDHVEAGTLANLLELHSFKVQIATTEAEFSSLAKRGSHLILVDHLIDKAVIQLVQANFTRKNRAPIMMLTQNPLRTEHVDFFVEKSIDSGTFIFTLSTIAQMVSEERQFYAFHYALLRRVLAALSDRVLRCPAYQGS